MELPPRVIETLLSADAKALATFGGDDVNVVPVSSVRIEGGKIWLINYFLDKTLSNILENRRGSLVFWKGLIGYQIKAAITHHAEGGAFDAAKQWIAEILPNRTVKGLMVLEPTAIFEVSPSNRGPIS